MYFVLQLGFTAVTAGVTWLATNKINDVHNDWEGEAKFYDHMACETRRIENMLRYDHGHVVETTIWHKDASGCMGMSLASILPIDHVVLVLRTDLGEYWSVEKNTKVIQIQRSEKLENIWKKLGSTLRDSSLIHDVAKETIFLNKWNIMNKSFHNEFEGLLTINDIITFIHENEVSKRFSFSDNCQTFLWRVITFMSDKAEKSISLYDYTIHRFDNIYNKYNTQICVSEVKWLYDGAYCIGFLIKTNKGDFWSFEHTASDIFIQHSNDYMDFIDMVNGRSREFVIIRASYAGFNACLIKSTNPSTIKVKLGDILDFFDKNGLKNKASERIENAMGFIYNVSNSKSADLRIFDYLVGKYVAIIDTLLNLPHNLRVSDFSVWYKMVKDTSDDATGISVHKSIVLVLQISNKEFWSIERIKEHTSIQISADKDKLINEICSVARIKPLQLVDTMQKKISNKLYQAKDLMEFLLEVHRRFPGKACEDCVQLILNYFGQSA